MMQFGEPITVITRTTTGVDADGNDADTETDTAVFGGFDPAIGSESTGGGKDQVSSQPQAYLPSGTAVTSTSVLVIRGLRYEVDGTPNVWQSPLTGRKPGIAVPLKRVTG